MFLAYFIRKLVEKCTNCRLNYVISLEHFFSMYFSDTPPNYQIAYFFFFASSMVLHRYAFFPQLIERIHFFLSFKLTFMNFQKAHQIVDLVYDCSLH